MTATGNNTDTATGAPSPAGQDLPLLAAGRLGGRAGGYRAAAGYPRGSRATDQAVRLRVAVFLAGVFFAVAVVFFAAVFFAVLLALDVLFAAAVLFEDVDFFAAWVDFLGAAVAFLAVDVDFLPPVCLGALRADLR